MPSSPEAGGRRGIEKNFEKTMGKKFPNFMKIINTLSRKLNKCEV